VNRKQSVVWIDERQACISRVDGEMQLECTIYASPLPKTSEAATADGSANDELHGFFFQVARSLDEATQILIVGPSATKLELIKYMHKHDHAFDPRIVGVETIEHADDPRIAGYAKLYFTSGGPR
jgi:hypothetical protein